MTPIEELELLRIEFNKTCDSYLGIDDSHCPYFGWCTHRNVRCMNSFLGGLDKIKNYLSLSPSLLNLRCKCCDGDKNSLICKTFKAVIAYRTANKKKCMHDFKKLDSLSKLTGGNYV